MQYAILIYETAEQFTQRGTPPYQAPYEAFTAALQEAGKIRGGQILQGPGTATTLKIEGGQRVVQDGPVADSREQLGGMYVIEAENLDEALAWAAKCPAAKACKVEVRPIGLVAGA